MIGNGRVVIIGAGPAGVEAARTLSQFGVKPLLLDEAERTGGQIYRRPPKAMTDVRKPTELYGFEASKAATVHSAITQAVGAGVDYQPLSTVWAVDERKVHYIQDGEPSSIEWSNLIIASGAMDRIVPLKGWTAPGVYTLGAAQIALKSQAALIGKDIIFFGTGPLLYYVAYQYLRAGANVKAVLDVSPRVGAAKVAGLLSDKSTFAKGLYYIAYLKMFGAKIERGIEPGEIILDEEGCAAGLSYVSSRGKERKLSADALAFGYGLKPETQIADLLDLHFTFDNLFHAWVPEQDQVGRSSNKRVFLAGDGGGIRGANLASLTGKRAAFAVLSKVGIQLDEDAVRRVSEEISTEQGFRFALERCFPFPTHLARKIPDEVIVCRCEAVTAGRLREAVEQAGEHEINRIKAFTRVGMGRCQGRLCMPSAAEVCAEYTKSTTQAVGRLRGQAPIKPITLGQLRKTPNE